MQPQDIAVPVVCFGVIIVFHVFEFVRLGPPRALFKQVRVGWVEENWLKGQACCNTTRDYIRVAQTLGATSILLAIAVATITANHYNSCSDNVGGCGSSESLLLVKLACLVGLMLMIFYQFTMCCRFAIHFSFIINTRFVEGVETPHALAVRLFDHAHMYYSMGIRTWFMTFPCLAWLFTDWGLLVVTPVYLFIIHGLESGVFLEPDLSDLKQQQSALQEKPRAATSTAGAATVVAQEPSHASHETFAVQPVRI